MGFESRPRGMAGAEMVEEVVVFSRVGTQATIVEKKNDQCIGVEQEKINATYLH